MDSSIKIGSLIKGRREALGLSQRKLAKMVGVSNSTVARWESGDIKGMRRANVILLSERLYISEEALMGKCEEPEEDLELLRARARIELALLGISDAKKLNAIMACINKIRRERDGKAHKED